MNKPLKKILVVNIAPIGDVIMSTAALKLLRSMHPQAHITLRIPAACRELLNNPNIVDHIDVHDPSGGGFKLSIYRSIQAFKYRRQNYDACFFFEETASVAKRLRFIPLRACAKYKPSGAPNKLTDYCNQVAMEDKPLVHMVDYYKRIVAPEDAYEEKTWVACVGQTITEQKEKKIALCFEVSPRNRHRWPRQYAVELLKALSEKGYRLFFFIEPGGGTYTRELVAETRIEATLREGSLLECAKGISGMSLLVAMDSGQVHLAAALGTPVLSLAGLTPKTTYPYTKKGLALSASEGCHDCRFIDRCLSNKGNNTAIPTGYSPPCMLNLPPAIVLKAIDDMLINPVQHDDYRII